MLAEGALQPDLKPVCVDLSTGPLASDSDASDRFVYFPVDALMTLGSENSADAILAVVGWHGCVAPGQVGRGAIQSHVMVPGRAYRVDWTPVAADPIRYASWLWHTTAATQSLIGQMAQWAFCLHHHTAEQHLASWLLHCVAQYPHANLDLNFHALPMSVRHLLEPSDAQNASGFDVHKGHLHITSPQRLAEQACSCHQKMAGAPNA